MGFLSHSHLLSFLPICSAPFFKTDVFSHLYHFPIYYVTSMSLAGMPLHCALGLPKTTLHHSLFPIAKIILLLIRSIHLPIGLSFQSSWRVRVHCVCILIVMSWRILVRILNYCSNRNSAIIIPSTFYVQDYLLKYERRLDGACFAFMWNQGDSMRPQDWLGEPCDSCIGACARSWNHWGGCRALELRCSSSMTK